MSSDKVSLLKNGIETRYFQKDVYRYIDLDKKTYDIIKNNQLWFSKAKDFNDPFDCNLSEKNYTQSDFESFKILSRETLQVNTDITRENWITEKNKIINEKGILCLSKVNSNILMWSHYAKKHTGVVLGFDMLHDLEFFINPLNVKYSIEYEELNYFLNPKDAIIQNLKIKSKDWEYENEIRIIKLHSGYWKFKPECLREIFFGCKTKDRDIEKFMNHCRINGFGHVKFFRAEMTHGAFSLSFVHL